MSIHKREIIWDQNNRFKDQNGQAHFPNIKLQSGEPDHIKLGKPSGYYPNMGKPNKKGH